MMNNNKLSKRETPQTTSELIERIPDPVKRAFLNNYHKTRRIKQTALAMGISERGVHYWLAGDEMFSTTFTQLKRELDIELQEHYESVVKDVVDDPKTPPQSRLLGSFFSLKALDSKYQDKQVAANVNIGEIIVQSAIPRPKYEAIEGEYTEIEGNAT